MSDLDSFYSKRSEQKCRYHFAHLPKSLTTLQQMKRTRMQSMQQQHFPAIDVQRLERSQSVCSLQTGLRNCSNCNTRITTTSSWVLDGQPKFESLQLNRQYWRPRRPSSPSPSLPTFPTHSGDDGGGGRVSSQKNPIAQLERDTLHRDIHRNSLSSRRGTKNFVINPLYNEKNFAESLERERKK